MSDECMCVHKKLASLAVVLIMLCHSILLIQLETRLIHASSNESLTSQESQILALISGTRAYNYDLELEQIAFKHNAFRVGGSAGANESAHWIKERFDSFGLESWLEPFEFTAWDLSSKPFLIIDDDGNQTTTLDQTVISSFQCEHYSWPTFQNGTFADLAILPLPEAANRSEIDGEKNPINMASWNAMNTSGKIVLIGVEVRWDRIWVETFLDKIRRQPPKAIVSTWWYDWMSFTPPVFDSINGRAHWPSQTAAGFVNYQDGMWIRDRESMTNVSARVSVNSVVGKGTHYNVVARIRGCENPEKVIIISGHYDTVMCAGFGDNGAGTSAVIELARVFSEAVEKGFYRPSYTLLFVAFAGEEMWMVGSINYVMQHKSEMANITAIINLDNIGSDGLVVTSTEPVAEFDLDQTILEAAQDVGINATLKSLTGSDHATFLNPLMAELTYFQIWGLHAGISDAKPVNSSAMLVSYPLNYVDKFSEGTPGWVHTEYDNSTSTQTLNWIEPKDLEDHIKVAALSVMRIPQSIQGAGEYFLLALLTLGVTVAVVIAAVMATYFFKIRKLPSKDVENELT